MRLRVAPLILFAVLLLGAEGTSRYPVARGTGAVLSGPQDAPTPALDLDLLRTTDNEFVRAEALLGGRPTAFFYFSATCGHCIAVAPEIAALAKRLAGKVDFVGVATGSNSLVEVREFKEKFGLDFELYKDFARRFGAGNRASSTPQLLVFRRSPVPGAESLVETVFEARPYRPGSGLALEMRARSLAGEDPFGAIEPGRYYGTTACGACHTVEHESWSLTHHSVAYWTLVDDKKDQDPECVGCHVTGWKQEHGFESPEEHGALAEVGCESCHGPGGPHGGERRPAAAAREVCVSCHDAKHSVRFSVERALPHVDHAVSHSLSAEQFKEARKAILQGSAPRPLTAFPEGRNLGDGACVECHAAEHKAWKKDPHARAMKTLARAGSAADPGCVSCHAVARAEPPATAADYHPGGVSCEACHGPGEQHVAAKGGTENIVGLGESCPVCVVEAICTRCHTPEQDPDWDLGTALPKAGHR